MMRLGNIKSSAQVPVLVSALFIMSLANDALHLFIQAIISSQVPEFNCFTIWKGATLISLISLVFSTLSTYHIVIGLTNAFPVIKKFEIFYQLTIFMRFLAHMGKTVALAVLIIEGGEELVEDQLIGRMFATLTICLGIRDMFEILTQSLYAISGTRVRSRLCLAPLYVILLIISIILTCVSTLLVSYPVEFLGQNSCSVMIFIIFFATVTGLFLHMMACVVRLLAELCWMEFHIDIYNSV